MKIRFYGGSLDGQERMVPETPSAHIRVMPDDSSDLDDIEVYALHFIAGAAQEFPVYAIQGWTGDDLIARLLK